MTSTRVRPPRSFRRADAFHEQLKRESDRPCVVLAVSMLDQAITALLKATLVAVPASKDTLLREGYGPLGAFGPKCDLAYRIGLINAEFLLALHMARRLRNEFAHGTERRTFGMHEIRRKVQAFGAIQHIPITPEPRGPKSTRRHFERAVTWMLFALWKIEEHVVRIPAAPHEGLREYLAAEKRKQTDAEAAT